MFWMKQPCSKCSYIGSFNTSNVSKIDIYLCPKVNFKITDDLFGITLILKAGNEEWEYYSYPLGIYKDEERWEECKKTLSDEEFENAIEKGNPFYKMIEKNILYAGRIFDHTSKKETRIGIKFKNEESYSLVVLEDSGQNLEFKL
jgi:hypothetical protein